MLSLCRKEEAHFMKERIKLIRNIIGISQSKFASSLLISRSGVCKMADAQLAGEDSFKYRFLAAISEYTDEDWKDLERLLDKWYKGIGNCS